MDMGHSNPSLIKVIIKQFSKLLIPLLVLSILFTSLLLKFSIRERISQDKQIANLENKISTLSTDLSSKQLKVKDLEKDLSQIRKQTFTLPDEDIKEVLDFVSSTMGISENNLPKIRYISREEFSKEINEELEKNKPQDNDIDTTRIILQTFGFIDKNKSNKDLLHEFVESQTNFPIAFYDPPKFELTFIRGLSTSKIYYKYILSHELSHYIQSKYLNINDKRKELENDDTDKYYSFLALVEGSAEVVAEKYAKSLNFDEKLELQNALKAVSTTSDVQKVSKFDITWSQFVYLNGKEFASSINDLNYLNNLIKTGEITSESIYNPSTYISKDASLKEKDVDFIFLNIDPNFSQKEDDVFGEFGCNLVIFSLKDKSEKICSGWDGDKFRLYKAQSGNEFIIVYVTNWETNRDAIEAQNGFNTTFKDLGLYFRQKLVDNNLITIITNNESMSLDREIGKIIVK